MPKPYDATTKFLVESFPADWLAFAGLGPPGSVNVIDANLSTITAEADKVIRVDEPEPWLAHIELQTSHQRDLPRRLLRYNALLNDRHDLPTRSIVVLLRPQADGDDLTGVYQRSLPGRPAFLEFRYEVVRAWLQPVESVLTGGLGTLPMASVSDLSGMEPAEVIRRMQDRVAQEPIQDRGLFWSATGMLMGLRYHRDQIRNLLRGVRDMKESSFYQMILDEGRDEGRASEARRLLLILGRNRWGEPDPQVVEAIESLDDLEQLEALFLRIWQASSWKELLAEPPVEE